MRPWPWPANPPLALIVDDQDTNLRLLGRVLTDAGFDVMPANSGDQALRRLAAATPDVILLDAHMPGNGGSEVLQQIRSSEAWSNIQVVLLSAAHGREMLRQAFAAGADDYVSKPFSDEEIVARIATHAELARHRAATLPPTD